MTDPTRLTSTHDIIVTFTIGGLGLIFITLCITSVQAIRTSRKNPAEVLKFD
jgi:hypothetical protein